MRKQAKPTDTLTSVFFVLILMVASCASAQSEDYQLGMGYKLTEGLTVGGYISAEYVSNETTDKFVIDDLALLLHGERGNRFSWLVELESVDFYSRDFETGDTDTNLIPAVERLYGDYRYSDYLSVRIGKQITPIGYWNLQPINVLRETTSNPRFSREMFPKFLSGIDLYGYTPFDESTTWHLFHQGTKDLDDQYINIDIDQHTGLSLERNMDARWSLGGSVGHFARIDDSRSNYFQLNSKYEAGKWLFTAEGILSETHAAGMPDADARAAYLQTEYRVNMRHNLVARAEYYRDEFDGEQERIRVLGYSFRPQYPISIKLEYQWHEQSADNRLLTSFSVLF